MASSWPRLGRAVAALWRFLAAENGPLAGRSAEISLYDMHFTVDWFGAATQTTMKAHVALDKLQIVIHVAAVKGACRYLLLGSASVDRLQQSGETLAGRIACLELGPFDSLETPAGEHDTLWSRGGFPSSYLAASDVASFRWRQDFIRTYLDRDIPQFGPRIPAETMRRLWTMLAQSQGEMLNAATLARSLSIDGKTVARYLDLLFPPRVDLSRIFKEVSFFAVVARTGGYEIVRQPRPSNQKWCVSPLSRVRPRHGLRSGTNSWYTD
jgi:hypothetical protein